MFGLLDCIIIILNNYLVMAICSLEKAEEQSPCESDVWPGTDGDSGRDSTAHSPEGSKGSSPYNNPGADDV